MALVRCEKHGKPVGKTQTYTASVNPIGYPRTSSICGNADCAEPGLIWLNATEKAAYDKGERFFRVPTFAVKLKAE